MLDWAKILAFFNVAFALGIVIINIRLVRGGIYDRIFRLFIIGLGLYWAGIYVYVIIAEPGAIEPVRFGQMFIRPAFTATLGVMLASGIYRWRNSK